MDSIRQQGRNQLKPLIPHYDKVLCITGRVIAVLLWLWTISSFILLMISIGCFLYLVSCIVTFLEFSKLLEKRIADGEENLFRKFVKFFLAVDNKQRSIFYFVNFIIIALLFQSEYGRVFISFFMLVMAFLNFAKWFFLQDGSNDNENDPEMGQREATNDDDESSNDNVPTSEVGGGQERSTQVNRKTNKNDSDTDEEDAVELYSV